MRTDSKYKYFIEDLDTGEWYYNVMRLPQGHTAHTTIYYPKERYWTNNPEEALQFDDKVLIKNILDAMLKEENSNLMTDTYGIFKRLAITEHEFVNTPQ